MFLIFHRNLMLFLLFYCVKSPGFITLYKANSTHHYRWHQMLLKKYTGVFCWWSPCTPTDSARFPCIYSTTVSRCCGWEGEQTGCISLLWHHTAAWSTPWRPSVDSSSYHTPCPSCHYGGFRLYQSSGPDLQSVWLLSFLSHIKYTLWNYYRKNKYYIICSRLMLSKVFPNWKMRTGGQLVSWTTF